MQLDTDQIRVLTSQHDHDLAYIQYLDALSKVDTSDYLNEDDPGVTITEDGHKKRECPECEALEHLHHLARYGKCETCFLEGR